MAERLTGRAIDVLCAAARHNLVRVQLIRPLGSKWLTSSEQVNHTAMAMWNRKYIERVPGQRWWPMLSTDPKLRGRLRFPDGQVETYGLTQTGRAALYVQLGPDATERLLGPVPQ